MELDKYLEAEEVFRRMKEKVPEGYVIPPVGKMPKIYSSQEIAELYNNDSMARRLISGIAELIYNLRRLEEEKLRNR